MAASILIRPPAIFENSILEGASEIDVVMRILMLRQRIAVQETLAHSPDDFHDRVRRIRAVRHIDLGESGLSVSRPQNGYLSECRAHEVFDGPWINEINAPLRCGDVFRQTSDDQMYILLAQPCDLVVRGDGLRSREEATFVKVTCCQANETGSQRHFVVDGIGPDSQSWLIDFKTAFAINLRALEMAVFNSAGRVEWRKDQEPPSALLAGWRRRFDQLARQMKEQDVPDSVGLICFVGNTINAQCSFTDGLRHYPLKRTGRVRSPRAEAIQGSFATFISRAAFDHDFAKGTYTAKAQQEKTANEGSEAQATAS